MENETRPRARETGIAPGVYPPGPLNAITDVPGVVVGHTTLIEGTDIRTGLTVILPHRGNIYQEKVPAGVVVGNGYGKMTGSTQIQELGELETPIVLTNTLAVPQAADAIIDWTLQHPGNANVRSVNPVVGETNDGLLNDIRRRAVTAEMVSAAIQAAFAQDSGSRPVPEGAVGAGTGTVAFGWKGGIGTSSRVIPHEEGSYTVGSLVQTNFGGHLSIMGLPVWQRIPTPDHNHLRKDAPGSIMIVVATDAPLSDRNLTRLARRALAGLARTGAAFSDGSGDYVISFSTSRAVRRTPRRRSRLAEIQELPNAKMNQLFLGVIEATEEAIYNSLFKAVSMSGYGDFRAEALPVDEVSKTLRPLRSAK